MKVRQKLKSEPEEGGAYETNIKIKKEAEVRTYHSSSSVHQSFKTIVAGSHPGGRRAKTTTTRAEQGSRNQMPKQEEGEDDNPGGRERDCGSAEREPEGRGCTS